MSYVAAKLCHFEHLTTRARRSEAAAACSSVGLARQSLKSVNFYAKKR